MTVWQAGLIGMYEESSLTSNFAYNRWSMAHDADYKLWQFLLEPHKGTVGRLLNMSKTWFYPKTICCKTEPGEQADCPAGHQHTVLGQVRLDACRNKTVVVMHMHHNNCIAHMCDTAHSTNHTIVASHHAEFWHAQVGRYSLILCVGSYWGHTIKSA